MESLWITIPFTLLLAGTLVALVVRAARRGDYEDWEGPAARLLHDDDSLPELPGGAAPADVADPGADRAADRAPDAAPEAHAIRPPARTAGRP